MESFRAGFRDYLVAFLVAVFLGVFVRTFLVQAFRVPSRSMEPGLLPGDHILVNKFVYGGDRLGGSRALLPMRKVECGDVVVFASPLRPGQDFIKRCIGLSGETVEVAGAGLRIDHRLLDETGYLDAGSRQYGSDSGEAFGPRRIPAGHLFCLGDSRHRSNDSRSFGPIPSRLLKGQALMIYWSVDAKPNTGNPGIWSKIESSFRGYYQWLLHSRWQRSLRRVR